MYTYAFKHLLSVFIVLLACCSTGYAEPLPEDAAIAVSNINSAAKQQDLKTLRLLMTPDFIWSFGGDHSAEQAIEAWQANLAVLNKLAHVTQQPCVMATSTEFECPSHEELGYRAGFKLTSSGWRMFYFVEGD
jgi:hypothetical protein